MSGALRVTLGFSSVADLWFICMYAPEGCPHGTHTNRTAYTDQGTPNFLLPLPSREPCPF